MSTSKKASATPVQHGPPPSINQLRMQMTQAGAHGRRAERLRCLTP